MVHQELSKEELLNEELVYDAWVDAKYEALKEEAVLCGYCKQPTTDEDIMCETCFAGVMRTTSANGEGSASPPEKGTEAVGGMDGTDVEGTQEEGLCDYHRYVQDGK